METDVQSGAGGFGRHFGSRAPGSLKSSSRALDSASDPSGAAGPPGEGIRQSRLQIARIPAPAGGILGLPAQLALRRRVEHVLCPALRPPLSAAAGW